MCLVIRRISLLFETNFHSVFAPTLGSPAIVKLHVRTYVFNLCQIKKLIFNLLTLDPFSVLREDNIFKFITFIIFICI